jgi:hypothetical protein
VAVIKKLKQIGVLENMERGKGRLPLGSPERAIAILCSDRRADTLRHLRKILQLSPESLFPIDLFGLPLLLSKEFGGYNKELAEGIIKNLKKGMSLLKISDVYIAYHLPCGMGDDFKHKIQDIFAWMPSMMSWWFNSDPFFVYKNVQIICQYRTEGSRGEVRQKSRRVNLHRLTPLVKGGKIDI